MQKCKAQPNMVATRLGGWVARWLARWLAGWVAGWLAGRVAGRLEPPPLTGTRPHEIIVLHEMKTGIPGLTRDGSNCLTPVLWI